MIRHKVMIIMISVIAVVLTLLSQESLAYYSTTGRAVNVVTSGGVTFAIHEKTDSGDDFPSEGVTVIPGDIVSKRVTVENVCEHPFYLRVKLVYGASQQALSPEDCMKLDIDTTYWESHDGWYYYKGAVAPGETTPEVFSKVEIVGDRVDNRYLGKTLTLTVVAQAVQSEFNPVNGTDTYLAAGWPTE